jgi:hypothetical protein
LKSNRFGSALVLGLSLLACNRSDETRTRSPPAPIAPAVSSAPNVATPTEASAAIPSPMIQRTKLGTVSVNTEPYCRKLAGADADAGVRPNHPWLADAVVQEKLGVLDAELKPYAASLVGITFENEPKVAIVVVYPDFTAYDELQTKLAARVKPLEVAIRPSCHTAEQLAEALALLQGRAWHPRASTTPVAWHLDAASSAYAVVVDDSAPEVADALRHKLGERVFVTLGKPRRLPLVRGGASGGGAQP